MCTCVSASPFVFQNGLKWLKDSSTKLIKDVAGTPKIILQLPHTHTHADSMCTCLRRRRRMSPFGQVALWAPSSGVRDVSTSIAWGSITCLSTALGRTWRVPLGRWGSGSVERHVIIARERHAIVTRERHVIIVRVMRRGAGTGRVIRRSVIAVVVPHEEATAPFQFPSPSVPNTFVRQ
jgi:hypothetical protein